MSARPTISPKVMVTVAIMQTTDGLRCPLCTRRIWPGDKRRLEHMTPRAIRIALGLDPDAPENLRWVHDECAKAKDFGKSKATCADGDIHKIAKAKRVAARHAYHQAVVRGEADRLQGKIKSRKTTWPKRPFPSRLEVRK